VQAAVAADEPVVEPVDAELIFDDVLSSLSNDIQESNAQITRGALPAVAVKDIHLQQLLQNLIGNALKYRKDSESPCVHVSAKPAGSFWLFSVADNGIGIAPQFHAQIFAVFKRLHPKGGKYPGTGIGLSICQRIIERYGGKIWLESDAGQGATFHFTLPAGNPD
jgi:light-regulated signal transduction histidine kinase (bacteriophytochrome)